MIKFLYIKYNVLHILPLSLRKHSMLCGTVIIGTMKKKEIGMERQSQNLLRFCFHCMYGTPLFSYLEVSYFVIV
jgi:hypothetical protein